MIGQEIFTDSPVDHKQDNRATYYCDLLDDDKYVAQFLNADDFNLDFNPPSVQQQAIQMIYQQPEEIKQMPENKLIQEVKGSKKRSSFHNFQKHLVTTIRSIIDSSKFGKNPETASCQKKIWRIFMNSNKINKTLVTIVVGDLNLESSQKIIQYGFKEIVKEFKPAQIKQAQQNIGEQILRQLKVANLEDQLASRRMKHKKQFVIYFQAFLQQYINGQLDKRMAKCTKLLKNQNL